MHENRTGRQGIIHFFFCALLCLFVAIESGCSKRETLVERGNREGVLHFSIGSDPTDLDPHIVTGIGEARVIHALFEPLVSFDPQTLKPAPALAKSWDVSPNGLVYTFHLQPNAKWSNGEPVTAQDCVDSWHRMLTPSLAADYAYLFYLIKGAEAFNVGRTTDFSTVGLAAPDPRTFVVTLWQPAPYFLQILLNSPWRPVNVRSIAAVGDAYQRGTPWTRVGRIVTSGPFILKEWTPQGRLVAEKSPTYWDKDNVRLNAIIFYPTDNIDAEERAFRAGQLHVTYNLSLAKLATYRQPAARRLREHVLLPLQHAPRPAGRRPPAPRALARHRPPAHRRQDPAGRAETRGYARAAGHPGLYRAGPPAARP
jgi:oligopeptide transport system substrate-binding protein